MQTTQTETTANAKAEALAAQGEREVLSRQFQTLTVEIRQIREVLKKD